MNARLTYGRALILLALLATALRLASLSSVTDRTPDERVYTQRAKILLQSGSAGMREEVKRFEIDREYPTPTRIGYLQLLAWTMRLSRRHDPLAGAILSCVASIGSFLVLALIGYRFFPPLPVLSALLLYAVFPLELDVARRSWADAPYEFLSLLLLWLACEIARDPDRRRWLVLFAMAGSAGLTVKEAIVLPCGLCGIWVLWVLLVRRRGWKNAALLLTAAIAGAAAALAWLANSVGSLTQVLEIVGKSQADMKTQPYMQYCCAGPPHLVLQSLWILTPVGALLTLAGIYAVVWRPAGDESETLPLRWIAFIAGGQLLFTMLTWMNLRYLIAVSGPACLLAGFGFCYLVTRVRESLPENPWRPLWGSVAVAGLLAIAMADYARFERIFVRDGLPDPTVRAIVDEAAR